MGDIDRYGPESVLDCYSHILKKVFFEEDSRYSQSLERVEEVILKRNFEEREHMVVLISERERKSKGNDRTLEWAVWIKAGERMVKTGRLIRN